MLYEYEKVYLHMRTFSKNNLYISKVEKVFFKNQVMMLVKSYQATERFKLILILFPTFYSGLELAQLYL